MIYLNNKLVCLIMACIPLYVSPIYANIVNYDDFSSTSGLSLVGDTMTALTSDGTVLRLTNASPYQSGAAYSATSFTLGSNDIFSSQFQFRFTDQGGIDPADGITLVLAANPSGLGIAGGGLGYQGASTNSVAIEFDTYDNGILDGNSSNHIAVDIAGKLTDSALNNVYGISTCAFVSTKGCMSNGDLWTVNIGYDGTTLTASLYDPSMGVAFNALNYAINLSNILGSNQAYVGFTSATGSGYENHDIINWSYSDTAQLAPGSNVPPATVPEPTTLTLMSLVVGMSFARRHRPAYFSRKFS